MRYPTIRREDSRRLTAEFVSEGWRQPAENEISMVGTGSELDLPDFKELARVLRESHQIFVKLDPPKDRDEFEANCAGSLHRLCRELPVPVLDDPDFWAWLTLTHFWWLTFWREEAAFEKGDPQKYMLYIDGHRSTECVLSRMFIRAEISCIEDDYALATAVPKGTDFWRSHVIRVKTGLAKPLARELIKEQSERRMSTAELRSFARRLNRINSNLVPLMLDGDASASLIEELRSE